MHSFTFPTSTSAIGTIEIGERTVLKVDRGMYCSSRVVCRNDNKDTVFIFEKGSIPSDITELDMRRTRAIFKPGALGENLSALYIRDIEKGSYYPANTRVFVSEYSGNYHSLGENFRIDSSSVENVKVPQRIWIFTASEYGMPIPEGYTDVDDSYNRCQYFNSKQLECSIVPIESKC